MEIIYRALLARFTASAPLFTDNNLKPIAHLDRFKGQYLNPELHQAYPVPAIFFKFNIVWEDKGSNTQRGNGILEVHVELENYHESYLSSQDLDEALVDYQYLAIIHSILQGFQDESFGPLSRMTTEEDENPSNTNVTIMRYSFTIDDNSTDIYIDWVREKLDDMITIRKPERSVPAIEDDDQFVV
jgi:hypothetical protein